MNRSHATSQTYMYKCNDFNRWLGIRYWRRSSSRLIPHRRGNTDVDDEMIHMKGMVDMNCGSEMTLRMILAVRSLKIFWNFNWVEKGVKTIQDFILAHLNPTLRPIYADDKI